MEQLLGTETFTDHSVQMALIGTCGAVTFQVSFIPIHIVKRFPMEDKDTMRSQI